MSLSFIRVANKSCNPKSMIINKQNHLKNLLKTNGNKDSKRSAKKLGLSQIKVNENNSKSGDIKQFVKTFKNNQQKYATGLTSNDVHKNDSYNFSSKNQSMLEVDKKCVEKDVNPLQVNIDNIQKKAENIILEDLQKRIQELLKIKLTKKYINRTMLTSKIRQDQIQLELKSLIDKLKDYDTYQNQMVSPTQENINNQIKDIQIKINILEKIIAESFTESEMLKKYYFAKRTLKKGDNRQNNISVSCDNLITKQINDNSSFQKSKGLYFRTNSQLSFTKPTKENYQAKSTINQDKKCYAPNRQHLPKSSYQEDYLNYGSLPIYKHRKSQNYLCFSGSDNRSTIYKGDFNQKKPSKTDNRSLDCRKDKFKLGKIPFMGKQYSTAPQNMKVKSSRRPLAESSNLYNTLPSFGANFRKSQTSQNSLNQMAYKSEYEWQYKAQKPSINSFIKDKNLSTLKMNLKNQMKA